MPRFNIPQNRVDLDPGKASPQAFGAGVGQAMAGVGQAVGDVAQVIQKKRDDAENTQISMESTDLTHDLKASLDKFKNDYPDGAGLSEAYEKHVDEQINNYVSSVSPKKQAKVREHFAKIKSNLVLESIGAQSRLFAVNQKERIENQINVASANIERGSDYTFELDLLQDTVNTLSPEIRPIVQAEVRDKILEVEFKRSLDQDGYTETKKRFESGEFDDMKPETRTRWMNAAKGKVKSDILKTISSARDAVRSGQVTHDLSGAIRTASEMGLSDEAGELSMLQNASDYSYDFARQSFLAQDSEVERLLTKGFNEPLSDEERLYLDVAEKHTRYRKNMVESGHAYKYYESLGVIPDVEPLPLMSKDPDEWSESIDSRESIRQAIMLRDGIDPGLMTMDEVTLFQSTLKDLTPGNYADRLSVIVDNFGPERIKTVAKEINRKDSSLAGHLSIAASDPLLLSRIMAGKDMPVDIPKEADIKSKMAELGYTTSGLSSTVLNNLHENVESFMKWRVAQGHKVDQKFIEESLVSLMPKPGVMSNGSFAVQMKSEEGTYIDHNSFAKAFKNVTDDDLEALGVPSPAFGKTPMSMEDILPHARIIPLDNEKEFYLVKDSTGEPFRDASGSVVTFNADKLIQQVETRRASERTTRWQRRQQRNSE